MQDDGLVRNVPNNVNCANVLQSEPLQWEQGIRLPESYCKGLSSLYIAQEVAVKAGERVT